MMLEVFAQNANPQQAQKMSAYLRNRFVFFGLPAPLRRSLSKDFLKEKASQDGIDWAWVYDMWAYDKREAQYLACDYLRQKKVSRRLVLADLKHLQQLITSKSWWDSVDALDEIVAVLLLKDASTKSVILTWAQADDFWLRRVAIDCQLGLKEAVDTELLATVIGCNLAGSPFDKEFFINKAIGWALRDYAKYNPDWVRDFIQDHQSQMSSLSLREASKYL